MFKILKTCSSSPELPKQFSNTAGWTRTAIKGSEIEKTVKAAKWKMAEDGEGRLKMEDEGGSWGWKSPEDGSAAQSSAHPCPPCNR